MKNFFKNLFGGASAENSEQSQKINEKEEKHDMDNSTRIRLTREYLADKTNNWGKMVNDFPADSNFVKDFLASPVNSAMLLPRDVNRLGFEHPQLYYKSKETGDLMNVPLYFTAMSSFVEVREMEDELEGLIFSFERYKTERENLRAISHTQEGKAKLDSIEKKINEIGYQIGSLRAKIDFKIKRYIEEAIPGLDFGKNPFGKSFRDYVIEDLHKKHSQK